MQLLVNLIVFCQETAVQLKLLIWTGINPEPLPKQKNIFGTFLVRRRTTLLFFHQTNVFILCEKLTISFSLISVDAQEN